MKVAVMQPYLFPYIGYWQLIHAVDVFVILDDVSFRKKSFINRNRILLDQQAWLFTLPLLRASQNRRINEIEVDGDGTRLLCTLRHAYARAPQFERVYPLLEAALQGGMSNLAALLGHSLRMLSEVLGLGTRFISASVLDPASRRCGQERILDLVEALGGEGYVNLPGGRALYRDQDFAIRNIALGFIDSQPLRYRQFGADFVPDLSIIDVLMFNSLERVQDLLKGYRIAAATQTMVSER